MESYTCVMCGDQKVGYGNNAEPVAKGLCCDGCNIQVVIQRVMSATEPHEDCGHSCCDEDEGDLTEQVRYDENEEGEEVIADEVIQVPILWQAVTKEEWEAAGASDKKPAGFTKATTEAGKTVYLLYYGPADARPENEYGSS